MNIFKKLAFLENAASSFGFQWGNSEQIFSQIKSECAEIETHLKDHNKEKLQEEIGDLLHAVFSLCIFNQFDPEETLKLSIDKFERRFNLVQRLAKEDGLTHLHGKSFENLMNYWNKAKKL